jgi:hypothetical protein
MECDGRLSDWKLMKVLMIWELQQKVRPELLLYVCHILSAS